MPSGPTPGGPSANGPAPGGHAPSGYTPNGPTAGGPGAPAPSAGGPGGFGPSGGYTPPAGGSNTPGDGNHNQGGFGPMGGAPMGGAPGGGPGGRQGDNPTFSTDASTAAPSAFADSGTYTDPRGGTSDRMPEQRGVPSQPNQGFSAPPPVGGGFGPQPGGGSPQQGGPSPQQGGGPRPEFGPGARPFGPNQNAGFGPDGGQRPGTGPEALNRPQPGQPGQPGGPARPGTQPGGPPTRPDAGTQPGGPTTRPDGTQPGGPRPDAGTQPGGPTTRPDGTQPGGPRPDAGTQPGGPTTRPDGTQPGGPTNRPDTGTTRPDTSQAPDTTNRPDATATPDTDTRPGGKPEPDVSRSPEPDVSRSPEPDVSRSPDDGTTPDPDNKPDINGEDSDGPTPDNDSPDNTDSDSDSDTDAPPIKGETDDGPKVDEEGVPLNYLGNRQGEHPFADMGEYIPMGGDRSNGMGSYDQRVEPLIADHNPWGEHGTREEFNAHHRPDGTFATNRWPDNDGAVPGSERQVTLPPGTVLDRFGAESGRFLSPLGTDGQPYHYSERAIFPDNAEVGYHIYVVDDPNGLPGTLADVAPALGQDGGGRQFTLPEDVKLAQLIKDGVLREVHVPPTDGRVLPDSFGHDNGDGTQNNDTVSVDDAQHGDTGDSTPDSTPDTDTGDATPPLPDNLQQVADNSSFRTPAGGALFDPSDVRTRNAASAVAPIDGHFILDVHSDGQHAIVGGQRLNGSDLADMARHLGWNGTDPIILNGCEAGSRPDGLAADLARASNAQVIAPTQRSWSGEQNTTPYSSSVDSVDDSGRARPTIPPDGGWRSFDPDGGMRDTGSNGLPVDTQSPGDATPGDQTPGTPGDQTPATPGDAGDGPTPAADSDQQPIRFGDDVDRGRIQSPFTPPTVTDPNAPHTINVDNNAAASANPTDPHRPLADGERLIGRTGLNANSEYHVPGRGTYYTDGTGTITHADLEVSNTRDGIKVGGADQNPDASYPQPNTTYRIDVDGAQHSYTTDGAGLPPRYVDWNPPQTTGTPVTFPSTDPNLPANSDLVRPQTRTDPLSDRTGWPPNSQIVHTTPDGRVTTLYTGDADPNTGTARVVAIDTWSSPGNGANNNVLVNDLNPELNNFPPNTTTRIDGQDVYVTNDHGVTHHATDERTYGTSAPRSGEAQDLVAALGTGTDGGHIRPTGADGAPDARNQFPQDSDENRPQRGQPSRETWYGQDMEASREQQRRGTTHLWHDLVTEGSTTGHPGQPTAVHERWVMQDSSGRIRLHFRRYDN